MRSEEVSACIQGNRQVERIRQLKTVSLGFNY